MSTGSSGAVASALMAAACGGLLLHTTRMAHSATTHLQQQRFYLYLSASLVVLIVMHVMQCVFAADPQTDIRLAQLIVHLAAAAAVSATAIQGWIIRGHHGTAHTATAQGATVKGVNEAAGAVRSRPSLSFFSISRRARNDSPMQSSSAGDEEPAVPMAMLREKFRLESKLRESRRQVMQLTTSLNLLHYCVPLSPRRPFALTSMPRGESLLAGLQAAEFEPLQAVVARLNQEVLARCIAHPSAALAYPLPVVWQHLRDAERLLLHPVAIELLKSFLVAQPAHPAFPAVEPVAAVMLILDAKRLPLADRTTLPKLLANLLSCYLGRCDEPTPPPCMLPLSTSLLGRFTAALVQWKAESAHPQTTPGAAELLLLTVQTLFAEAALECTHWLALLYLPGFQQSAANKLAMFCVGLTESVDSAQPPMRRVHSDPKAAAEAAVTMAAQRHNLGLPPSTAHSRRGGPGLSVHLPPTVASRGRVLVHSPSSRGADGTPTSTRKGFGWNLPSDRSATPTVPAAHLSQAPRPTHHTSSSSLEMAAHEVASLRSSTPSPQQHSAPAPQAEPPALMVRPKLVHWKSHEQAKPVAGSSPPPVSPTRSAPVSATAPVLSLDRECPPRDASASAPASAPSPHSPSSSGGRGGSSPSAVGSLSSSRVPHTHTPLAPQMSLRKAVLIAAQEGATPNMHAAAANSAATPPQPVLVHLESTPE